MAPGTFAAAEKTDLSFAETRKKVVQVRFMLWKSLTLEYLILI